MKKIRGIYVGISLIFFGMVGCATQPNIVTPTTGIEKKETLAPTKEMEKKETPIPTKEVTITPEVIKEDKLLEALKELPISMEGYNALNRKLSLDAEIGWEGNSDFCVDETTGIIYFVNQGKDNYLYQIKEGEVQVAVEMPVQQIYPYQGLVYFMVGKSDTYDLQEKHSGDIYCYTPASGAVELIYEVGAVEGSSEYKLTVEESGIYFSYVIREGNRGKKFYYQLPFGEKEPIKDTKWMTTKGWKDYSFLGGVLKSRTKKEDGTREEIELSISQYCYCVVGDILYSADGTSISCIDLNTKEQTAYDFSKAIQKVEGRNSNARIETFTITKDAVWATTGGSSLYRMDLQSGTIKSAKIRDENGDWHQIRILYTDGKELYGVKKMFMTNETEVFHILVNGTSNAETMEVMVESLTE